MYTVDILFVIDAIKIQMRSLALVFSYSLFSLSATSLSLPQNSTQPKFLCSSSSQLSNISTNQASSRDVIDWVWPQLNELVNVRNEWETITYRITSYGPGLPFRETLEVVQEMFNLKIKIDKLNRWNWIGPAPQVWDYENYLHEEVAIKFIFFNDWRVRKIALSRLFVDVYNRSFGNGVRKFFAELGQVDERDEFVAKGAFELQFRGWSFENEDAVQ